MAGLFDAVMRTDAGGGVMGVLALPSVLLRAHLFLILNSSISDYDDYIIV